MTSLRLFRSVREFKMAIRATCSQCGKTYSVPEKNAGKRFRCRECSAAVTVPSAGSRERRPTKPSVNRGVPPRKKASAAAGIADDDDDFLNDLESLAASSQQVAALPPPVAGAARPSKATKKSKRSSRGNADGGRSFASQLGRGLLVALVLLVGVPFAIGVFRAVRDAVPVGDVSSWPVATLGDTGVTIRMPKKPNFRTKRGPFSTNKVWESHRINAAWIASFEEIGAVQSLDPTETQVEQMRQAVVQELRSRPQIAEILDESAVQSTQGYFRFDITTKNYLKGSSGRTGTFSYRYFILSDGVFSLGYGAAKHSAADAERYFSTVKLPPKG